MSNLNSFVTKSLVWAPMPTLDMDTEKWIVEISPVWLTYWGGELMYAEFTSDTPMPTAPIVNLAGVAVKGSEGWLFTKEVEADTFSPLEGWTKGNLKFLLEQGDVDGAISLFNTAIKAGTSFKGKFRRWFFDRVEAKSSITFDAAKPRYNWCNPANGISHLEEVKVVDTFTKPAVTKAAVEEIEEVDKTTCERPRARRSQRKAKGQYRPWQQR